MPLEDVHKYGKYKKIHFKFGILLQQKSGVENLALKCNFLKNSLYFLLNIISIFD